MTIGAIQTGRGVPRFPAMSAPPSIGPPSSPGTISRADLAHHRLALVVPALLQRTPATFTLRLERGATVRTFRVVEGVVVESTSTDVREHLAQVLANLGMLELTSAAEAFDRARAAGLPLGAWLLRERLIDAERLRDALSHKAREAFFDCYGWSCGELTVEEASPENAGAGADGTATGGVAVPLALDSLHRDGLSRVREWKTFREHFPENDATFRAHRHVAAEWRSREEDRLVELADGGASLGELLAAGREGPLFSARRLLRLYRQGVLTPRAAKGPRVGETLDLARLVSLVRTLLAEGRYDSAASVAAQAVERAAVPEACALYREAEAHLRRTVGAELEALEGGLRLQPLPQPVPTAVTADDLHLYALLRDRGSVRGALEGAAMDCLGAWRSLRRLGAAGIVTAPGAAGEGLAPQGRATSR